MKKLALFFVLASLSVAAMAQDTIAAWKQLPRHEIQVGIGDPLLPCLFIGEFGLGYQTFFWEQSSAREWFYSDVYSGTKFISPAITVSYRYRVAKWCWVGATVSLVSTHQNMYDRISGERMGFNNNNVISIMPSVMFTWLNRKYVTFYSGLSVGLGFDAGSYFETSTGMNQRYILVDMIGFQLTTFGVKAGKKWYGFAELGFGMQGIISGGFGYRFNGKRK